MRCVLHKCMLYHFRSDALLLDLSPPDRSSIHFILFSSVRRYRLERLDWASPMAASPRRAMCQLAAANLCSTSASNAAAGSLHIFEMSGTCCLGVANTTGIDLNNGMRIRRAFIGTARGIHHVTLRLLELTFRWRHTEAATASPAATTSASEDALLRAAANLCSTSASNAAAGSLHNKPRDTICLASASPGFPLRPRIPARHVLVSPPLVMSFTHIHTTCEGSNILLVL